MLTKSPAELLRSLDRLAGGRRRETRQTARSVAVPRMHRGGDTYALAWRSDPRLLAILTRCAEREREAREKGQSAWRGDELAERAWRAGAHPHRLLFRNPQEVYGDADAVRSVPRV